MTYEESKAYARQLDQQRKTASEKLNAVGGKSDMGLTPDHVKATPAWKETKKEYEHTAAETANFYRWFNKAFKKEIAADRRINGYNWMK